LSWREQATRTETQEGNQGAGAQSLYLHHVRGSHYFLRKADRNVVIPYHTKDLKPGTLRAIIDQSSLTIDELLALL
jgi:HicA toxin of bacterial toxin-antitoxin,